MTFSQREIADAFGVTTRTIRAWDAEGMPSRGQGRERKYELPLCVSWRIERAVVSALAAGSHHAPSKADSEARLFSARAGLAELDLAERRGQLLPLETVEEVFGGRLLDTLRAGLSNLPGRWGSQVVGLTSAREGEAVLKRATVELLEEWSGPAADALESGSDLPTVAGSADA